MRLKQNRIIFRGVLCTPLIFIIFLFSFSSLISITLPAWVIEIPSSDNNKFAVGVSDNYSNLDLALEKAFDMACYDLACQKQAFVRSKSLDVVGSNLVFFESVLPDSSDIEFYRRNAKILSYYTDERYTYLLAAIDSISVETNLIEVNKSSFLSRRDNYVSNDDVYRGYGSSKYVDSIGFVYAAIRARINICEQIRIRISNLTQESNISTLVISEESSELWISGFRISGYYVSYNNNEITAFAEFVNKEE